MELLYDVVVVRKIPILKSLSEHNTFELVLEPFDRVLLGDLVVHSNARLADCEQETIRIERFG
jgi:hypothetical protein